MKYGMELYIHVKQRHKNKLNHLGPSFITYGLSFITYVPSFITYGPSFVKYTGACPGTVRLKTDRRYDQKMFKAINKKKHYIQALVLKLSVLLF